MHIDWASLAEVAVVAAAAALTVVLLVAFALVSLSGPPGRRVDGPDGVRPSTVGPVARRAVAVLCVLAAGLVVCYGLLLIIA